MSDTLAWLRGFAAAERKVYSQNGEDGVLAHIFDRINTTSRFYVEFGTESGVETNTRLLRSVLSEQQQPWTGLLMDGAYENLDINLHRHTINETNIVSLLQMYRVSKEFDLLSVDVNCEDWWITRSILHAGFRPRVLVNEVNSVFRPPDARVVARHVTPYCSEPYMNTYFGASVSAFSMLYRAYGYRMVYCEREGVNCFAVRDDILQPFAGAPTTKDAKTIGIILSDASLYRPPRYGRTGAGHHCDPLGRKWVRVSNLTHASTRASGGAGREEVMDMMMPHATEVMTIDAHRHSCRAQSNANATHHEHVGRGGAHAAKVLSFDLPWSRYGGGRVVAFVVLLLGACLYVVRMECMRILTEERDRATADDGGEGEEEDASDRELDLERVKLETSY